MTATQDARQPARDRQRPPSQGGPAADHRPHPLDRQHHAARDAAPRDGAQPVRAREHHQHRHRGGEAGAQRGRRPHRRRTLADEPGRAASTPGRSPTDQVAPTHLPIAVDRVAFAGEIVAVVVARTAAEARDAAELVDVDYDELPAALDLKEAARGRGPRAPRPRHQQVGVLGASTRPRPAPAATSTRRSRRPAATGS